MSSLINTFFLVLLWHQMFWISCNPLAKYFIAMKKYIEKKKHVFFHFKRFLRKTFFCAYICKYPGWESYPLCYSYLQDDHFAISLLVCLIKLCVKFSPLFPYSTCKIWSLGLDWLKSPLSRPETSSLLASPLLSSFAF